jgi:hypothetical protein
MVLGPSESVEDLVSTGNASCPGCGGALRKWGWARWRVVRDLNGEWGLRPSRVRCDDCGVTHVVLPAEVLVRRRDAMAVVGRAWRSFARGSGARRVARVLGVPMETVRGWLRRLRALARDRYGSFPSLDQPALGTTLTFVVGEAARAGYHAEADLWRFVAYRSQGQLLYNTSWP